MGKLLLKDAERVCRAVMILMLLTAGIRNFFSGGGILRLLLHTVSD